MPSDTATLIHQRAIVIDGLSTSKLTPEHFVRMRTGGLTAVNWTAVHYMNGFAGAMQDLVSARNLIDKYCEHLVLGDSVQAIRLAKESGRTAIVLGMQNGKPIEDNLGYIRVLKEMGVRVIQPTYNERNFIGDGCTEPKNSGLSQFGIRAIHEMNRLGILIDLSHCGLATTAEAIEVSTQPVAITHSTPLKLCPSPRNKTDDIIRALAQKGGVFGLCAWSPISYSDPQRRPTLSDFCDAIEYVVDLVGNTEHVGFGTDHGEGVYTREDWESHWGLHGLYPSVTGTLGPWYGYDTRYVENLESVAHFPRLTEELVMRGYSEESITGILGGNFLKLFLQVWGQ